MGMSCLKTMQFSMWLVLAETSCLRLLCQRWKL